jgi:ribosomal-protein-alanine N-acetyltransferase
VLTTCFSPFPFLETARLRLRNVVQEDAPEIYYLRSDESVLQYLDRMPATSLEEAAQFIQTSNRQEQNGDAITWALSLGNDPTLIGTIGFWNIKKEHYRAELGYALHPDYQGKGLMQEALTAVLQYGFNAIKLHSVEANVNPGNVASIRLLERNGFTREGYFRENYYFNGQFLDSAVYSLIAR